MQSLNHFKIADWLHQYKKRIILTIASVITLAIAVMMVFIATILQTRLLADSKLKTRELSDVIQLSIGHLMLTRDPGKIQSTLVTLGKSESSVVKAFILDKNGKVAYSSKHEEIGNLIDRFTDPSCSGCHAGPVIVPHDTTMIITEDGEKVLRNVSIIYNEKSCHGCHALSDKINGKLIIDCSLRPTQALVKTVVIMIVGSGALCLAVLVFFLSKILSRGVDKYINEILLKSTELTLLYGIVERLSKTIEIDELKHIVVEIIKEAFDADEVDIVLPKDGREYSCITWIKIDNKMVRRKIDKTDALSVAIDSWLSGKLTEENISDDRKEVYMPVSKGCSRLALIVMRKKGTAAFDPHRLVMVRAMGSHIAAAFENAALYHIAITDELTGLYSKRHLRTSISKKFELYEQFGEKVTFLMLDIDNFKKINDTYGHPVGDHVLKQIGQCILDSTREEDTDFRYGGEEFAVILPATDSTAGSFVAERIRKRIEETVFIDGDLKLRMTVSIGAATCPENAVTIKELITEADKALYEAKRAGKNRVVRSTATPA